MRVPRCFLARFRRHSLHATVLLTLLCATVGGKTSAAGEMTPPDEFLGHRVAADYKLARYERLVEYFEHVGENSDRVAVRVLGETTEGLPLVMAEISAEENLQDVERHRRNQRKLADPRLIGDGGEERRLIEESPVVVLINCNLHSTEIASSQMALELLHDLATGDSPEVREILEGTIVLLIPSANPDGLNKVIDWYERSRNEPWEGSGMPWLYQKYAGHDNNRDWFMLALEETRLITQMLYHEWFPAIVCDIHQMGRTGARFFVPPFHDPKNANVHPLIDQSLMIIGGHMAAALARENKTGVLHGAVFDNWWSGGFRTTPYRHNMVGILTEAASPRIATPVFQEKSDLRGRRRGMPDYTTLTNFPDPWPGGWWRLRDVADYEKIATMSLLTLAARYGDMFQGNYIRMGREAIERGETEPPFAWLVPPDQRDPGSAARMLDILHAGGIEVHQAEEEFTADGIEYPAGTYLLYCAQPYRAHLNDMMERQVYPDRAAYPGGPAEPPYDIAGWTLPLQMGVRHLAVARPFECSAKKLNSIPYPESKVQGSEDAACYVVPVGGNDDHRLINRLHQAGIRFSYYEGEGDEDVDWQADDGSPWSAGTLMIHNGEQLQAALPELVDGLGTTLVGLSPEVGSSLQSHLENMEAASQPRVGLYQPWTASIDEGWTRLVLENFEFPFTSVHNADIRAGNLKARYDCLVLPSLTARSILAGRAEDTTAAEYVGGIGREGIVCLQDFVQAGGTLVCIDRSCDLPIEHFNIPVRNILKGKSSKEFFCPGSVLRVAVDSSHPVGYGLPEWVSGYFTRSQAFEIDESGGGRNSNRTPAERFPATVVARYSDTVLLESGWIRGDDLIADKPAIVEVQYGKGHIILLGFRVQHRAQPHGTFRLLFNALARSR